MEEVVHVVLYYTMWIRRDVVITLLAILSAVGLTEHAKWWLSYGTKQEWAKMWFLRDWAWQLRMEEVVDLFYIIGKSKKVVVDELSKTRLRLEEVDENEQHVR